MNIIIVIIFAIILCFNSIISHIKQHLNIKHNNENEIEVNEQNCINERNRKKTNISKPMNESLYSIKNLDNYFYT